jgi:predicted transcriptional regulator
VSYSSTEIELLPLFLKGRIELLRLLAKKEKRMSFREIFVEVGSRFSDEGELSKCLLELTKMKLLKREMKEGAAIFQITSLGKTILKHFDNIAKALKSIH